MPPFISSDALLPPRSLPSPSDTTITVDAPAKINLFLHVVGQRADGYHLLESVFCLTTLADTLTLEKTAPKSGIRRTGDIVGDPSRDLCVRAARALEQAAHRTFDVAIHVKKRIPSGAGMGGGSSDAAATLVAMNRFFALGLTKTELLEIAVTLGADVPFFVFGETAFVTGIGEVLTPISVPEARVLLVMPETATSTAGIFSDPALTKNTKSLKMTGLSSEMAAVWPHLVGRNDLEPVVLRRNAETRAALKHLGDGARMTGSGSAVFKLIPPEGPVVDSVPEHMQGWIARIQPRHSLFHWLRPSS